MSKLIVLCGIPGSGKSTWARNYYNSHLGSKIVSSDEIRKSLYGDASIQGDGKKVFNIAYGMAIADAGVGIDVIFDATNITRKDRKRLVDTIGKYFDSKECVYLNISTDTAKKRNNNRDRVVPEEVIDKMVSKLESPTCDYPVIMWDKVTVVPND